MNVIFMGTPDFAVPTLQMLIDEGHTISAVVTQPDRPKGRGNKVLMPPVKELTIPSAEYLEASSRILSEQ